MTADDINSPPLARTFLYSTAQYHRAYFEVRVPRALAEHHVALSIGVLPFLGWSPGTSSFAKDVNSTPLCLPYAPETT